MTPSSINPRPSNCGAAPVSLTLRHESQLQALASTLFWPADPELYGAMGDSAAAFGAELQQRGVRAPESVHAIEEPDDTAQDLQNFWPSSMPAGRNRKF